MAHFVVINGLLPPESKTSFPGAKTSCVDKSVRVASSILSWMGPIGGGREKSPRQVLSSTSASEEKKKRKCRLDMFFFSLNLFTRDHHLQWVEKKEKPKVSGGRRPLNPRESQRNIHLHWPRGLEACHQSWGLAGSAARFLAATWTYCRLLGVRREKRPLAWASNWVSAARLCRRWRVR